MALDEQITDPNGGGTDAGTIEAPSTQAPAAPAARTYSDADMANARRAFQADSQREWQRREAAIRAEFEQRFVPREQPKATDPWSQFDPTVAGPLKALFEHEFQSRLSPFQQQQEDLAFSRDELEVRNRYPDYGENRADILEFAVQNGIVNLDAAYHAWRSMNRWQDPDEIGKAAVAAYTRKKTAQASRTPAVEGRGGGAPSSKQQPKSREEMDAIAEEMLRAANESSA